MKFTVTEGCVSHCVLAEGEVFWDLPKSKQEELVDYLLKKAKEEFLVGLVSIDDILKLFEATEYKHDEEPCDTCGDYVCTTTWEI